MRESEVEKQFVAAVKAAGGQALKFTSQTMNGVPDRLVLLIGGKCAFVELKAPGKQMRILQRKRRQQLEALGFPVFCVDRLEQVLAHAAERPSELFGLLDYIFDHANGDVDEAETRILDEIKRWVRDMCKMIAGKKVQLKKLKEQLLSAPTLTPVEAYYAMNSGCSGEGERVQSSHISDPTAKAAIGALDYIIRTWRDDYKKSLKKYGTLAGDIYLLEMAADYVGGEQGTVVRQIYVDGVFWKDAVGLEGKSLSWQVIRKMERQAQEEMAEFILKYWKTQREENEEDMKDGTEKVV